MRLLIAAALLLTSPTLAQVRATAPDGFKFMNHAEIDKLVSTPEPGRVYGATFMNDHETYYTEFVKRLDHGNMPEQHPHWLDQITRLSGEGVLTYGGTIAGRRRGRAPGEVRGGTGVGGTMTQATCRAGRLRADPGGHARTSSTAAPGNIDSAMWSIKRAVSLAHRRGRPGAAATVD